MPVAPNDVVNDVSQIQSSRHLHDFPYLSRPKASRDTPSRKDGISIADEGTYRLLQNKVILSASSELKLPSTVTWAAGLYFLRYFSRRSYARNDFVLVAGAALLMAAKAEEEPKALNDVAWAISRACRKLGNNLAKLPHPPALPPLPPTLDLPTEAAREAAKAAFEGFKEDILIAERAILYTLGFNLHTDPPYQVIVNTLADMGFTKLVPRGSPYAIPSPANAAPTPAANGASKHMAPATSPPASNGSCGASDLVPSDAYIRMFKATWWFLNDTGRTTLALQFPSRLLARVFALLSAEKLGISLPQDPDQLCYADRICVPSQEAVLTHKQSEEIKIGLGKSYNTKIASDSEGTSSQPSPSHPPPAPHAPPLHAVPPARPPPSTSTHADPAKPPAARPLLAVTPGSDAKSQPPAASSALVGRGGPSAVRREMASDSVPAAPASTSTSGSASTAMATSATTATAAAMLSVHVSGPVCVTVSVQVDQAGVPGQALAAAGSTVHVLAGASAAHGCAPLQAAAPAAVAARAACTAVTASSSPSQPEEGEVVEEEGELANAPNSASAPSPWHQSESVGPVGHTLAPTTPVFMLTPLRDGPMGRKRARASEDGGLPELKRSPAPACAAAPVAGGEDT